MRLSSLFGRTLREAPADVELPAHRLLLRAGLARPLLAGGYALLPLGMAVLRRLEAIIHAELLAIDVQEFRTPVVQSAAPWQRSGRYANYGPLMLRFADRAGRDLIFAPTHEEAVAELAAREISSYRQLPAIIYQVHTKYRDELRPRGGLLRMREFSMLDAYSLGKDHADLDAAYTTIAAAFERIFERCGLQFVGVAAGAGEMGGSETCEYVAFSASGEDLLATCAACGYAANREVATTSFAAAPAADVPPISEVATPDCTTIAGLAALLGIPAAQTAKAVFFSSPERPLIFAVIRGDREINEPALQQAAGVSALEPATAEQIRAAGAVPGYASPLGLDRAQAFVIADSSVPAAGPLVAGANRAGYHLRDVLYGRDWRADLLADIGLVQAGDACPRCGAPLSLASGIELGHVFKLGTRYSEALEATFLDQNGKTRPVVMGSYGIGLERLMQVIVEQHHDEQGIIWPAAVAPADVHLVALGKKPELRTAAEELYAELRAAGLRVLFDDRDEPAGVKFNDADLIGLPLRLLISERLLTGGEVELKPRGGAARRVTRGEAVGGVANRE